MLPKQDKRRLYKCHIKYLNPRKTKGYNVTGTEILFEIKSDAIKFANGEPVRDWLDKPYQIDPNKEKVTHITDTTGNTIWTQHDKSALDPRFPVGKQFYVTGTTEELWIDNYKDITVTSNVTIKKQPHPYAKKVLVTIDTIDNDHNITTMINKRFLY